MRAAPEEEGQATLRGGGRTLGPLAVPSALLACLLGPGGAAHYRLISSCLPIPCADSESGAGPLLVQGASLPRTPPAAPTSQGAQAPPPQHGLTLKLLRTGVSTVIQNAANCSPTPDGRTE